jgi:hypothetical protein
LEPVQSNNHPHWTLFIIGTKVFLRKAVNTDLCAALGFLISTPSKEIKQVWSYSLLLFLVFCCTSMHRTEMTTTDIKFIPTTDLRTFLANQLLQQLKQVENTRYVLYSQEKGDIKIIDQISIGQIKFFSFIIF